MTPNPLNLNVIQVPLASARLVLNATRAKGGKQSESTIISTTPEGDGLETKRATVEHVDHVEAVKRVDGAVRRIHKAIARHATHTQLGWLVTEARVAALEDAMQDALGACADANQFAELAGSGRRVYPGLVYATVKFDDPAVARHVYEAILEKLADAKAKLELAPVDSLSALKSELETLAELAVGIQRRYIMNCAAAVAPILADRKAGKVPDLTAFGGSERLFR